ncbi:MAG TPA: c-type cytochrome, partial [Thermoanaerobaculia bacterium]
GAALFVERCAGCHTIGGGDREGPDLTAATKMPHDELEVAVRRMVEYAGPMTDAQIDALVALLNDPGVKARIAAAQNPPAGKAVPPGDPAIGKKLFFGGTKLAGGGSPCFACHSAAGRGGNLARDLTGATDRLGESAFLTATERPGFPMMKAAYANRAVTEGEARHIAAYLATTGARLGEPERIRPVHAAAGGFTILTLAGVAILFRARRAGVRERLLRDAERRERT